MTQHNITMPFWLDPQPVFFPPTHLAMIEPDGLLAVGGDLTPEWLLHAYSKGIFPWFNPEEPILWWTPNPRSVLFLDDVKLRKSLKKRLRQLLKNPGFSVKFDCNFKEVMSQCAQMPRHGQDGTWISNAMIKAYEKLHQAGHAHSVEVYLDDQLIGGLYGVAIGKMFYGESMFAKQTDASKIALIVLANQLKEWGFRAIDTQVETAHLNSLGAQCISRLAFEGLIAQQTAKPFPAKKWHLDSQWHQKLLG
ncbi:leucyl/phenylalanyl-tRNA--protein transferase [Thiomicrorhabdus sediminis]|uniref:Leucyl/phenylalanyl-tRNA--protein transferase n=1 Tax=Thiomicrorhabdus sediminis TaxID=2580412 RepID=A0A4P9K7H0_9GAMM|nr:leucyl/phenylalanyl-tRNA--protein transferase [Thiomicrorhabdus sediminis]QCU90286.1 leucyl/phenylalanyl-tRNA--protein transferase [Thiomicrorhabdus sediminis]